MISFLYRLSNANHYKSLKMISIELRKPLWELPLNTFDEKECAKLSILSEVDKKILYNKSYFSFLNEIEEDQYKIWFLRSKAKYCPECLAEKRIHKFLWGLRPVSLCTRHSVVLVNECENCKHKIRINTLINGKCNYCNFNLEHADAIKVNKYEYLYVSQKKIQQSFIHGSVDEFGGLNKFQVIKLFDALLRLFDGFESFIELKGNECNSKICLKASNEMDNTVSVANIYWMLYVDFPQNFIRALDVFQNSDSPRKKYRKRQLSNFLSTHEEFSSIKGALELFKEIQIKKGSVPRNLATFDTKSSSKLKSLYFTKRDLFKQFDISWGEIERMCEKKILDPKKITIESHINYYFERRETEKIIKTYLNEKKDLITKKEAAKILNLHVGAIAHFIERGLLKQTIGSVEKQHAFICKKSVDSLIEQLVQKVIVVEKKDTQKLIVFEKCLDKYVTSGLQIGKLIKWAISEQINFYSMTKEININSLYFEDADLKNQLKKEDIETNGYTLGDVSRILGFTERTLHKMMRAKLISPNSVRAGRNGNQLYFFAKVQVEQFKEIYISSVDASVKYNVNFSTLNNLSHRKVLKNYMRGVCRKTLFKKSELENELIKRGFIEVID